MISLDKIRKNYWWYQHFRLNSKLECFKSFSYTAGFGIVWPKIFCWELEFGYWFNNHFVYLLIFHLIRLIWIILSLSKPIFVMLYICPYSSFIQDFNSIISNILKFQTCIAAIQIIISRFIDIWVIKGLHFLF